MPRTFFARLCLWACLAGAGPAALAASNCDEIKAGIDAKVRAGGVTQFTLTVVDADAKAEGRTVGSCDRGSKKIVYRAGTASGAPAAPAAPASSAAKRKPEPILTECKDGSVSVGGDCGRTPR